MSRAPRPRTQRLSGTPRNLARLARALRAGQLVAVPTETVYGLAANALSPAACRRIFTAKRRPTDDPLIVHIHDLRQWDALADVSPEALLAAGAFWPGPLTIVLPKKPAVPDLATAGLPSVAVRMPAHPLFRRLLKACALPLAAPSANPFGYLSPTTAGHVLDHLSGRIPFVLDGGPCAIGVESTILDLRNPRRPAILRPGAISADDLSRVLQRRVAPYRGKIVTGGDAAPAPGMLSQHYSPRTPLTLLKRAGRNTFSSILPGQALVLLAKPASAPAVPDGVTVRWLSAKADPAEAAHALFDCIRKLDTGNHSRIWVELPRGRSALAEAMRDRLSRAAAKTV
ncbi:L-threonylcarbamoyladenylate synthase [Nibricoccus sp. IMCC34717]|uniref:L-threonylcarbamoyladenylate synthase n=1 Tax=Nibricoccus sp. IMCC34717 TaxID=3034021 RepID=UPI00384CBDA8